MTAIDKAISALEHYKFSPEAQQIAQKHPSEAIRRQSYLNNLSYQLHLFLRDPNEANLSLIIDDIEDALVHKFYAAVEGKNEHKLDTTFNNILSAVCERLHHYKNIYENIETTRLHIRKCYRELPTHISNLMASIRQVQHFIEFDMEINFNIQTRHRQCYRSLFQEEISERTVLVNTYKEFLERSNNSQSSEAYAPPLNLIADPEHYHKITTESGATFLSADSELYLCQAYLNIALALQTYRNKLSHFAHISNYYSIKARIRPIFSVFMQLQQSLNDIVQNKTQYQKKIISLAHAGHLANQSDMVKYIRFVDRLTMKMQSLMEEIKHIRNQTSVLFAYILDESVTKIRDRNARSRLELLLSDLPYEPLSQVAVQRAYQHTRMSNTHPISSLNKYSALLDKQLVQ